MTTAATGGVLLELCGEVGFTCARSVNDGTRRKRPVIGRVKRVRLLAGASLFSKE